MRLFLVLAALLSAMPVRAHEFWISPETYMIAADGQLVAHLRVGQNFSGSAHSYIPDKFVRFDLVAGEATVPVEGRMGDRPALSMAVPAEGLVTVVHQTTDYFLSYRNAARFAGFVTDKDLAWALAAHAGRGLPETGFRERYSRYAKSLVAVGCGAGADAEVGLTTEIVALANPYSGDLAGELPVRVLYQGEPRAGVQLEVFDKSPGGSVSVTRLSTDSGGLAVVPVRPGHEYLLDAVVLRPVDPEDAGGAVWESLWASLTFMVPAD